MPIDLFLYFPMNCPPIVHQERCGLRLPWMSLSSSPTVPPGDPCRPNSAATLTLRSPPGPVSSSTTTVRARSASLLFLIYLCLSVYCVSHPVCSFLVKQLSILDCRYWRGARTAGLCCQRTGSGQRQDWGWQSWLSAEDAGESLTTLNFLLASLTQVKFLCPCLIS